MTAFLVANLAPLMFGALVIFLLLGYPVAFSLAANGLFFGLIAIDLGLLQPQLLQALPEGRHAGIGCERGHSQPLGGLVPAPGG